MRTDCVVELTDECSTVRCRLPGFARVAWSHGRGRSAHRRLGLDRRRRSSTCTRVQSLRPSCSSQIHSPVPPCLANSFAILSEFAGECCVPLCVGLLLFTRHHRRRACLGEAESRKLVCLEAQRLCTTLAVSFINNALNRSIILTFVCRND